MSILNFRESAFGLDISNKSIKFLQLSKKGRSFKLGAFGKIELPPGILQKGRILNPEILVKYLKELLSKKQRSLSREVIVSLPENEVFSQVIQMPKMTQQELEKAVVFEAENYIPLPSSEMYLDFEIVEPVKDHLDHIDVFLAAASRKVVEEYLLVLKSAGLRPLAFEPESRAIFRAVIPKEKALFPTLILDLGETRTNFCIVAGRAVRFSGSMTFSGELIDQKIIQDLKVTKEKAKDIIKKYGILDTFNPVLKLKAIQTKTGQIQFSSQLVSGKKLAEILAPILSDFIKEIWRYLAFYSEHALHEHLPETNKGKIREIIITGGLANFKGLKEFLQKELGLKVQLANPWVNVLVPPLNSMPELDLAQSQQYTTAIGLALRGVSEK